MTTTTEIKIGDYIKAGYKFGLLEGVVTKVNKNVVVINVYSLYNGKVRKTERFSNITKSRIYEVHAVQPTQ